MIPGLPRWAWFALGAVVLVFAFYAILDRYGDSKYREGKAKADAEWQAASDRLIEKSLKAGTEADRKAAARGADFAAKVDDERKRIDQAVKDGGSPFDVIFGNQ